ncbi:MAG: hypothetical protein GY805_04945 [Chloroflexi bacterium]|nr:hypothetical protein [Chloroflexota bacterium]
MRGGNVHLRCQMGFIIFSTISLIAYLGLVRLDRLYGTLRAQYTPQTIAWYLLAFLAFVGLLIWAERNPVSMNWVWGTAVAFRLLLLFTTPTLSDDVYRYLWDGYVANNRVSPYAYAIDASELDYLDIPLRAQANNTWMASPYLPSAQWFFTLLTFVFPLKSLFLQATMVVFDLLSGLLIVQLLALAKLPQHRLLIYLWNPLVIVEVAHSAHIDAWMTFLTLLAIWLALKSEILSDGQRWRWSKIGAPLLLALATLTKVLPVMTAPVLFWRWSWRQWLVYGLTTMGLLLPSAMRAGWGLTGPLDGTGLFGALRIYGSQWKFNSGIFYWLETWLHQQGVDDPLAAAKQIGFVLILVVLLIVWVVARVQRGIKMTLRLTAVPFMTYILLSPTVHPWYTLILIAFLPFLAPSQDESRWLWLLALPWLYLSGALVFSYLTYFDPQNFGELAWVRRLEWLPVLALLLVAVTLSGKYMLRK